MTWLRFVAAAAPFMAYAAPAAAVALAPPISALSYDFVGSTVTTDATGKSYEQVLMHGRVMTFADRARIDIDEAGSANGFMRGYYMLLSEGGSRIVWVNPKARQYRETDSESMFSGLNELSNGSNGLITMQASNVHIDAQKVGAGPVIQGHNTVHYRLSQHMDMKTKVLSKTATTHDDQVIDYYYATDIPRFINPFLSSAPSLPQDGTLFGDDYTKQLRAAIEKLYQGGAPLRTIVTAKSTDDMGHVQTTVTTTEVTNVRRGDVNLALFEIPTGYIKVSSLWSSMMDSQDNPQLGLITPSHPSQEDIYVPADNGAAHISSTRGAINGLHQSALY
jgi:hypothetical protein